MTAAPPAPPSLDKTQPRVISSALLPDVTPYYQVRVASRCGQEGGLKATVTTTTTATPASPTTQTLTPVPTLALYNFTLGLGFLYDFTRTTDFQPPRP